MLKFYTDIFPGITICENPLQKMVWIIRDGDSELLIMLSYKDIDLLQAIRKGALLESFTR